MFFPMLVTFPTRESDIKEALLILDLCFLMLKIAKINEEWPQSKSRKSKGHLGKLSLNN